MTDRICKIPGCERGGRMLKGMCHLHYDRVRKTGAPGPVDVIRVAKYANQVCSVETCQSLAASKGLCDAHYQRSRKHGDPLGGNPSPSVLKVVDLPNGTRICTKCDTAKPLSVFSPDKNASGGRRSQCKPCRSAHVRKWYAANQERQRDRQRARYTENIEEMRARDMERYLRDREKRIELATKHSHVRRARLLLLPADPEISVAKLRKRDGDLCHYCQIEMYFKSIPRGEDSPDRVRRASVEHLVPLSAGGHHIWSNVVLACLQCNLEKNRRSVEEWLASKGTDAADTDCDEAQVL